MRYGSNAATRPKGTRWAANIKSQTNKNLRCKQRWLEVEKKDASVERGRDRVLIMGCQTITLIVHSATAIFLLFDSITLGPILLENEQKKSNHLLARRYIHDRMQNSRPLSPVDDCSDALSCKGINTDRIEFFPLHTGLSIIYSRTGKKERVKMSWFEFTNVFCTGC